MCGSSVQRRKVCTILMAKLLRKRGLFENREERYLRNDRYCQEREELAYC